MKCASSSIHLLHSLLECLDCSLCHSVRCGVIGHGSDVTDSVLFEEIYKLSADKVAAIVHDDNFWQTMCRESDSQR